MKRATSFLAVSILGLNLSGCFYSYNHETLTYNSKVKEVKISGNSCTLTVSPPSLGGGTVSGIKAEECKNLSVGDDVTVREVTRNGKHTVRVLKGIYFNLP